jgi:hypothetical protein
MSWGNGKTRKKNAGSKCLEKKGVKFKILTLSRTNMNFFENKSGGEISYM